MSQLLYLNVTEKDKIRKRLLKTALCNRLRCFSYLKGKDRGREACHLVLVDMNKRQQYLFALEQNATGAIDAIDALDYGIILESAWGHEIPQSFKDREDHYETEFIEKLVCVKIRKDGCEQVYYTLSDVARDNDFLTASSEEEVRRIGKILYSTRDEDPAESLLTPLESVYLGLSEYEPRSCNQLFDSVRKGELQRVATFVEGGGEVDVVSYEDYGQSLMHYAAFSGKRDLVRFLKEKGASVDAQDQLCGRKPIHIAAKEGHPAVISYLLENGASVNECDRMNWTPLHYAVWRGDLDTIKFLLGRGAEIGAKDIFWGKAPIHIAAEHGYVHVMEYLLNVKGANIETEDADGRTPLYYSEKRIKCAKDIFWGKSPIGMEHLLNVKGANIETEDADGRTPLYYSVLEGEYEMFKFLIGNNASINVKNKSNGKTLLHASVYRCNYEIIEYLVKAGLEINQRMKYGWTPLLLAAANYKVSSLRYLADLGADLFAEDDDGESALVLSKDHADMVLHIVCRMCKKLQQEGKYRDALELYTRNIDSINTLGQDRVFLQLKKYLGDTLHEMGHLKQAADILSCVLRNAEKQLGPNHIFTRNIKEKLGLVEAQLNEKSLQEQDYISLTDGIKQILL